MTLAEFDPLMFGDHKWSWCHIVRSESRNIGFQNTDGRTIMMEVDLYVSTHEGENFVTSFFQPYIVVVAEELPA
jgi:hypothetical protein